MDVQHCPYVWMRHSLDLNRVCGLRRSMGALRVWVFKLGHSFTHESKNCAWFAATFCTTQTIVSRFRLGMNKLELNANPQVRLTSMIDILGVSVSPHLLPLLVRFHGIRTPPPLFGYTRMVTDLLNLHPQHVDVDVVLSGCSVYSSLLNSNND